MAYGKMHRFFLRTVASQGVLSMIEAHTVLERFNEEEELSVTDLVRAINDEIRPYSQEIKITKDEVTNEDVIVFLSLADDVATKAQNIFSSTELEYFRVLIEQIMSTESRQITGINAMNLVSSMTSKFTKTDAQKVLNTWCRMRYFDKDQDNYALGVRAIHEFEGYFRQNMEHAVEECFLCKHIVFRGYNCPGCAQAIHTRCLMRYLEKVQKWPCCKIDFEQEQLERLNNEGSRLPPTQLLDTTRLSEENNTEQTEQVQATQVQESSEMMDEAQDTVIPEISQRVSRKRKRQILPQTSNNPVVQPTEVPTTHRSASNNAVAEPIQVPTPRRSASNNAVAEPIQVATTRRSASNNAVAEPIQVPTTRRTASNNAVAEPIQVPTTRRSASNNAVAEPIQVPTTRRTVSNNAVAEPIQVPTTRRSASNNAVAEPIQVPTTRRTVSNNAVAEPIQVPTTRRSASNNAVAEPIQVPTTRRTASNNAVAEPIQVPTTRRSTRRNIKEEPVTEIEESFENMEVTDNVPEVTPRVTRKRKQQM